jgi:hypothetical protein
MPGSKKRVLYLQVYQLFEHSCQYYIQFRQIFFTLKFAFENLGFTGLTETIESDKLNPFAIFAI